MSPAVIELRQDTLRPGLAPLAVLETEPALNTLPRLPVRPDGPWLVWFAAAPSPAGAKAVVDGLMSAPLLGPPRQILRLGPTLRSRLRP